jgi:hypothetical protein
LRRLDARFSAWDDLAAELPTLYRRLKVRRAIEALPHAQQASCGATLGLD